jgi:hypothetical protein
LGTKRLPERFRNAALDMIQASTNAVGQKWEAHDDRLGTTTP